MKKYLFLFLLLSIISNFSKAQNHTSMIGIASSYEYFQNRTSYSQDKYTKALSFGIEYSEIKGMFGYRAGIHYSKVEDYIIYPNTLLFIDIFIVPTPSSLKMVDFPLTGQLYLGKKKLKLYANLGLISTIAHYNQVDEYFFYLTEEETGSKSFSIKSIYGGGILYQFSKHFGFDIGVNKKDLLRTLNNSYIQPMESFGIQTKLNYIF